jgi:hypothetical protein
MVENLRNVALQYWSLGLNVVLLKEKKPLHDWKKWIVERQTQQEFNDLPWNDATQYAVVCGTKLVNGEYLIVVDYDVKNLPPDVIDKGKTLVKLLPITQTEETPTGGRHLVYYTQKETRTDSSFHNVAAVEILSAGKLCIMAPSFGYKRLNDNTPTKVADLERVFHQGLDAAGITLPRQNEAWFDRKDLLGSPYKGKDPPCIEELLKGVSEGARNEACIRLSSYLVNFRNLSIPNALKILVKWNKRNNPPLLEDELKEIVASASTNGYVYGCSDPTFRRLCPSKTRCSIGIGNLDPTEAVKLALEENLEITLPIDYSDRTGLVIGAYADRSRQSFLFLSKKAFMTNSDALMLPEPFSFSIQVKRGKWMSINKITNRQVFLLASEFYTTNQIDFPSKSLVFENVLKRIRDYFWVSDDRWYVALASWVIGTYFHPAFAYYPILNVQGLRETGKTTLLDVIRHLAWNATARETALREAGLFRSIQDSRPTYVLDITRISGKQWLDVVDVCETGTETGGVVTRVNKDTGEPIRYETFGPKALATRYEVPFLPKCIRLLAETPPTELRRTYSKKRARLDKDQEWSNVVMALLKAAMKYWQEVIETYNQIEQTERLTGRRFNYWNPLLAVCKVFMPEKYAELLKLAEEDAEICESGDDLSEVENAVLNVLLNFANLAPESTFTLLLKVITENTVAILPWVKDWHMVKSALDNLGVSKQRYNVKNGVCYRFDVTWVRTKAASRGLATYEQLRKDEPSRDTVLAQENVQSVFESLQKECHLKEYVTAEELAIVTGLRKDELTKILEELERNGKATQPFQDMWRPIT